MRATVKPGFLHQADIFGPVFLRPMFRVIGCSKMEFGSGDERVIHYLILTNFRRSADVMVETSAATMITVKIIARLTMDLIGGERDQRRQGNALFSL